MVTLTPREKKILKEGLNKEYLELRDFHNEYKTQLTIRETIKRFLQFELIYQVQNRGNKFKVNRKLVLEILK